VNKYIQLCDSGKFYKIAFTVQDAHKPGPNNEAGFCPTPDSNTVRGDDLIGVMMVERNPVDGKICLTSLV